MSIEPDTLRELTAKALFAESTRGATTALADFSRAIAPVLPELIHSFHKSPAAIWDNNDASNDLRKVLRVCCLSMRCGVLTPIPLLEPLSSALNGEDRINRKAALQLIVWLGPAATPLREQVRGRLKSRDKKTRKLARQALDEITTPYVRPSVDAETFTDQALVGTVRTIEDHGEPPGTLFDPKLTDILASFGDLERGVIELLSYTIGTRRALNAATLALERFDAIDSGGLTATQQLAELSIQNRKLTQLAVVEVAESALTKAGSQAVNYEAFVLSLAASQRFDSGESVVAVLRQFLELRLSYSACAGTVLQETNRILDAISGKKVRKRDAVAVISALRSLQFATHSEAFVDDFMVTISVSGETEDHDAHFNVNEKGVPGPRRRKRGPRSFPKLSLRTSPLVEIKMT